MGIWNIPANLGSWEHVSAQIEKELQDNKCPFDVAISIMAAADEIIANISSYAYADCDGEVMIKTINKTLHDGRNEYRLIIYDHGVEFNPLNAPKHENGTLANKLYKTGKRGGYGIHIIRNKADKLIYKYKDGKNILCFVKFYIPAIRG